MWLKTIALLHKLLVWLSLILQTCLFSKFFILIDKILLSQVIKRSIFCLIVLILKLKWSMLNINPLHKLLIMTINPLILDLKRCNIVSVLFLKLFFKVLDLIDRNGTLTVDPFAVNLMVFLQFHDLKDTLYVRVGNEAKASRFLRPLVSHYNAIYYITEL